MVVIKLILTYCECCSCDLPCIHEACRLYKVARFYCDECNEETDLYYFDDKELCIDCITNRLEPVSYDD